MEVYGKEVEVQEEEEEEEQEAEDKEEELQVGWREKEVREAMKEGRKDRK